MKINHIYKQINMINNVVYSYLDKIINIVFVHYSEHSVFKKIVKLKYNTNELIKDLIQVKQLGYYVEFLENRYKYNKRKSPIPLKFWFYFDF